jgi:hypothetical protein
VGKNLFQRQIEPRSRGDFFGLRWIAPDPGAIRARAAKGGKTRYRTTTWFGCRAAIRIGTIAIGVAR